MTEVKNKISVGLILGWVVGAIFFITAIANIANNVLVGILFLIATAITLPPIVKLIEEKTKRQLSIGIKILSIIVLVILAGTFMSKDGKVDAPQNNQTASETNVATTESQQPAVAPKQIQESETPKQVVTPKEKSYQQVFAFSGNGAKKSEPFTITGSRFRINYDCSGDLCQAFLYKNGTMSGVLMNTAGPVKDQTIEYGAGEYYIDANVIGSYTMTVEDYR